MNPVEELKLHCKAAERPIRQLIHSYFLKFHKKYDLYKYGIAIRKVPDMYFELAELLADLETNPGFNKSIDTNNILAIPDYQLRIPISGPDPDPTGNLVYTVLRLSVGSNDSTPESDELRSEIGKLLGSAQITFMYLIRSYPVLQTLHCKPSGLSLILKDTRFPDYEHDLRITWCLETTAELD